MDENVADRSKSSKKGDEKPTGHVKHEPPVLGTITENGVTRPKIGLALGSGVARGWAHIGIVRRLQQSGIPIDVVAGTSIGAVVGGAMVSGGLDALEEWALGIGEYNFFRWLDFKWGRGGLFGGGQLNNLMDTKFGDYAIEDLPVPFTAIATDLKTGHEIWLNKGDLADSIQASFALPGVFQPQQIGNRWLVDGALVNPVPVSVCRSAGCEMVIAVNLSEDLYGRSRASRRKGKSTGEYGVFADIIRSPSVVGRKSAGAVFRQLFEHKDNAPSLFANMVASLNVIQNRLARSRMAGDPPDVTITPRVGHIGLMEFHRAAELIEEGRIAYDETEQLLQDALDGITYRINS